ncbi:hypothetical protein N0609_12755 [Pseudomonas aeruginosa]|nr:hypothetical protein [Pseudomonas aeruginosa]MCS8510134.1 hypothetical protein [Pseudomonas aeruginosa]MCS8541358.1 hypothetical protein [Pseudomonas aeruginosa]MCT0600504.1 hypothetical protein [Pseudomonas aeruginosa]
MKKVSVFALAVAATISTCAFAEGSEESLLSRNRTLQEMEFNRDRLKIQAEMAKSFKDMSDAGFIVDPQGVPKGIGDMERLALEVRRRGGAQASQGFNPSDPFNGADPVIPMPAGQGLFGDSGFPAPLPPPDSPAEAAKPAEPEPEKVEVVTKPTEREKAEGKKLLRLVELRGNSALFFTNDGFQEVKVGESIYDQKLTKLGVDNATLKGKDGSRVVRIDWTKSVRYADD